MQVTCNKKFRTTVYIEVLKASNLVICDVECLVSHLATEYVLLGETVL